MTSDHDDLRLLLGGYLLGGLDETDRDRLDAHLCDCAACRDELGRLRPVPDPLQRLPATEPPGPAAPSPERVDQLLSRMRAERAVRVRRTRLWGVAAAAAVLVVAAIGLGVWWPMPPAPPPPDVNLVTAQFVAVGDSAVAGHAVLTPKT